MIFLRIKINIFEFLFLDGFSTHFPNIMPIAQLWIVQLVLSQEESKFVDLVLQGAKKALFFSSNIIVLQSIWLNFLKDFPQINLIF
jgi:hypothetical protein